MINPGAPTPEPEPSNALTPIYRKESSGSAIHAHFPSGTVIAVEKGRERAYPDLATSAPNTRAFYEAVRFDEDPGHVIDLGSGSGSGTQLLESRFGHVTGVDIDPQALGFSRELCVHARFVQADICAVPPVDRADAAILIDTLGHVSDPLAALRHVRSCLSNTGTIFLAEPAAQVSQRLLPPARRAFSHRSLMALLTQAGFEGGPWLCEQGTFLATWGRPGIAEPWLAWARAQQLIASGSYREALEVIRTVQSGDHPRLALESTLCAGELCLELGDGDGAGSAFMNAAQLDSDDPRPLTGLARLCHLTQDVSHALEFALQGLSKDPTDPGSACVVGLLTEQLGHPDTLNAWRVAFNLAPDDVGIAAELARVAAEAGNCSLGIRALEHIRGYHDTLDPDFHTTLAWLMLRENRLDDAQLEVQMAAALDPTLTEITALWSALRAARTE